MEVLSSAGSFVWKRLFAIRDRAEAFIRWLIGVGFVDFLAGSMVIRCSFDGGLQCVKPNSCTCLRILSTFWLE